MKSKRITAIILAILLIVALASGCGSTGAGKSSGASASQPAPAEKTDAPAALPAAEPDKSAEPEPDDGSYPLPIVEEPVTVTLWSTFNPGALQYCDSYDDIAAWVESFERTNVFFESTLVGGNVGNEAFMIMTSTGDYTDVIASVEQFYTSGIKGAYDDGIIVNLRPYIEEFAPNFLTRLEQCSFTKNAQTDDGDMLCFVDLSMKKYAETGYAIRQDWLDQVGMEAPQTYDELYEVLKAINTENGSSMMLPESGLNGSNELISGFGVSVLRADTGAPQHSYIVEDGTVVSCRTSDGFREYLTLMHDWYQEGLLWNDFVSSEVQQAVNGRPGKGLEAVLNDKISFFPTEIDSVDSLPSMAANSAFALTAVKEPTKVAGETIVSKPDMRYGQLGWTISSLCDPELIPYICQYCDYMYSDEGAILTSFGIENETFVYDENGTPTYTELITKDELNRDFRTLDAVYLMSSAFVSLPEKVDACTSEAAMQAALTWRDGIGESIVPSEYASMTAEESDEFHGLFNDIATYFSESVLKFITGELDPSGADWDAYVTAMNDMGYEDCTPIIQAMYDRYTAR